MHDPSPHHPSPHHPSQHDLSLHSPSPTETSILGYRIARDPTDACRFEVTGPEGARVLASFADRHAAEQFVVMRELRSIEMRPRSPAY